MLSCIKKSHQQSHWWSSVVPRYTWQHKSRSHFLSLCFERRLRRRDDTATVQRKSRGREGKAGAEGTWFTFWIHQVWRHQVSHTSLPHILQLAWHQGVSSENWRESNTHWGREGGVGGVVAATTAIVSSRPLGLHRQRPSIVKVVHYKQMLSLRSTELRKTKQNQASMTEKKIFQSSICSNCNSVYLQPTAKFQFWRTRD